MPTANGWPTVNGFPVERAFAPGRIDRPYEPVVPEVGVPFVRPYVPPQPMPPTRPRVPVPGRFEPDPNPPDPGYQKFPGLPGYDPRGQDRPFDPNRYGGAEPDVDEPEPGTAPRQGVPLGSAPEYLHTPGAGREPETMERDPLYPDQGAELAVTGYAGWKVTPGFCNRQGGEPAYQHNSLCSYLVAAPAEQHEIAVPPSHQGLGPYNWAQYQVAQRNAAPGYDLVEQMTEYEWDTAPGDGSPRFAPLADPEVRPMADPQPQPAPLEVPYASPWPEFDPNANPFPEPRVDPLPSPATRGRARANEVPDVRQEVTVHPQSGRSEEKVTIGNYRPMPANPRTREVKIRLTASGLPYIVTEFGDLTDCFFNALPARIKKPLKDRAIRDSVLQNKKKKPKQKGVEDKKIPGRTTPHGGVAIPLHDKILTVYRNWDVLSTPITLKEDQIFGEKKKGQKATRMEKAVECAVANEITDFLIGQANRQSIGALNRKMQEQFGGYIRGNLGSGPAL